MVLTQQNREYTVRRIRSQFLSEVSHRYAKQLLGTRSVFYKILTVPLKEESLRLKIAWSGKKFVYHTSLSMGIIFCLRWHFGTFYLYGYLQLAKCISFHHKKYRLVAFLTECAGYHSLDC